MTGIIVSHQFSARFGNDFIASAKKSGVKLELLVLPADPEARTYRRKLSAAL